MKYILILLSTYLFQTANAQKGGIQVSAQSKTVNVSIDNEDPGKVLLINTKLKSIATGKLSIVNADWNKETDLKRTFEIFNSTDQPVLKVTPSKIKAKYEVLLKTLVAKMVKGETYFLYTIAIPKDPKKAALVRVRRLLVCRILIT